jgi:hypothetical protein
MEENFLHQLDKGDICHYPGFFKKPDSFSFSHGFGGPESGGIVSSSGRSRGFDLWVWTGFAALVKFQISGIMSVRSATG